MFQYFYDARSVGGRIRKIRKTNKMTQEQLAEKLYLSVDSISNFENGKQTCMPEHMMHLCEIFRVNMDYFYFDRKKEENGADDKYSDIISALEGCGEEDLGRVAQMIRLFLRK